MKKNLQSVTANLTDLAATMPSQKPMSVVRSAPAAPSEPLVQFSHEAVAPSRTRSAGR